MSAQPSPPTRERILDAAARVMRERGLGNASIKAIADEAGCSVALLYKYFDDQQAIYMGVLTERLGGMDILTDPTVNPRADLAVIVERLMAFYVGSFPMSASIFSTPELLRAWREELIARGRGGPQTPLVIVERYVRQHLPALDAAAVAALLVGAAFQAAFLACFDGLTAVPHAADRARVLVAAVIPPQATP
ncbi:TetR/AcrR family transcriptional regulator [Microbacterium caowuchunii]|uniref:TetR/AcrR family transcriptional regulator n=1 Tax=Microbacterium caowuchunii TaxID=2614638 RepID=UPI001244E105|nr:TetR/AcrR family transcriptional regulator [Microbacterium caowuchunii]QEW00170.1 TetR/AcrR family transcriptional regulator [Microbacterium caowuchunii]